jgi:hypothetical protein
VFVCACVWVCVRANQGTAQHLRGGCACVLKLECVCSLYVRALQVCLRVHSASAYSRCRHGVVVYVLVFAK